jgi:hypothetical protein
MLQNTLTEFVFVTEHKKDMDVKSTFFLTEVF